MTNCCENHESVSNSYHIGATSKTSRPYLRRSHQQWNSRSLGHSIFACLFSTLSLMLLISPAVRGETVMGVKNDEFDFDGLPGAQHDFKVFVHAGVEECFFQRVAHGAQFYARFEVLKGGNKQVDFYLRDPHGEIIEEKTGTEGFLSSFNLTEGVYAMCVDNVLERYGYKVVYIYMVTVVMHEWLQYQDEFQKVTNLASNFSESLTSVENSIVSMRQSQAHARFYVVRDWYLANGNLYYVGMWSMIQCGLIIFAAVAQVYSLRRLFRTTNTTPTSKPRA